MKYRGLVLVGLLAGVLLLPAAARAATDPMGSCTTPNGSCNPNITEAVCTAPNAGGVWKEDGVCGGMCFCASGLSANASNATASCVAVSNEADCLSKQTVASGLTCQFFTDPNDNGQQACADVNAQWGANKNQSSAVQSSYQSGASKLIPECLLKDDLSAECRDVSMFAYFGLAVVKYLFTIIGALALIMFVYGGFTLILSQGNPEKVKKGGEIMVAAVIGLVIVFGAYMLVSFLSETIGVKTEFQLK